MGYTYQNLLSFKNTASGIAEQVLIAPFEWFAADGVKSPDGDGVEITADHVFSNNEHGFAVYQLAPEKNSYDAKTIGERGSQKLEHELKIFIPGSYTEVHEAVKNLLNEPLIVLHKDAECSANIWYQLGCSCNYAFMKVDFSTGTTKDGVKGYSGTISYTSESVVIYAGTIKKLAITGDFESSDFSSDFATV